MTISTPAQLRFAPSAGFTLRADFNGGGLSSDLGPLLPRGVDQQIGLTERLAAAMDDRRHPGYVQHAVRDVLTQRIFQIASGYVDGNDSNALRDDPMFRLSAERKPFDAEAALASGATMSRFEHAATTRDVYRLSRALVEQFITGYATPPKPWSSTSTIPKTRLTGSNRWPSTITTTAAHVTCRCSSSTA